MKNEILIDLSSNDTVIFPTVSLAHSYLLALANSHLRVTGYRCSNASDFQRLQNIILEDYIEAINNNIN